MHVCTTHRLVSRCLGPRRVSVPTSLFLPSHRMASGSSYAANRTSTTEDHIWSELTALALNYNAINLGQGFPNFAAPSFMKKALARATMKDPLNQYTRSMGHPRLVNVLSDYFSPLYGRQLDPMAEILVAVGGDGCLFSAIYGFVNPGDEVVIIEPFFVWYQSVVKMAGGIPKFVPLKSVGKGIRNVASSGDFVLDPDELAAAFGPKTKAIIINTPNNPLGKVFSRKELEIIANLCIQHDVICISDEVYEWLVYDGCQHIRIATLPGMWERTVTYGSAGKTFSATGWKLGWTIGPADLIKCAHDIFVQSTYTCPTPIQEAVAIGFERELAVRGTEESYFKQLPASLMKKRDLLTNLLSEASMTPIIPEGGYFIMADTSPLNLIFESENNDPYDYEFARWFVKERGIACIPPSVFYSDEHKHLSGKFIRFCFCKEDETLEQAMQRIREWTETN